MKNLVAWHDVIRRQNNSQPLVHIWVVSLCPYSLSLVWSVVVSTVIFQVLLWHYIRKLGDRKHLSSFRDAVRSVHTLRIPRSQVIKLSKWQLITWLVIRSSVRPSIGTTTHTHDLFISRASLYHFSHVQFSAQRKRDLIYGLLFSELCTF